MAEAREVKVKLAVDSAEVTALLDRVREVVREELAAYDAKNAEAVRRGVTLTHDVKITGDLSKYITGMDRAHRRGSASF